MGNKEIILKMISLIEKVELYTNGMGYEQFIKNEMVVEACAFNFSQIGELSHQLEDEFQQNHPAIPWRGDLWNAQQNNS